VARIELNSISKRYPNGHQAVDNVCVDIQTGEFIALLGPSGCGKTTTLRMVAGLEEVTAGDIFIDGLRVNDKPPRERDVAMVFQSYALYPHMTVFENMAFGLRIRKISEPDINLRVNRAAEALGITEFLDRRPAQMSGGQRQRVAMGRAMVRQPKVFLFDEPLSNLDARLRTEMRMELGRLHRAQGATSLYVTHDQVEAMTLADRIVLMRDGTVQQIGSPMTLFNEPANVFTAGFIGHPTMNLLAGHFENDVLKIDDISVPVTRKRDATSVTVGIRPHDVELVDGATEGRGFEVEVVEPMGHETLLYLRRKDVRLTALTQNHEVGVGDIVGVSLREQKLHLFHGQKNTRL
jgi:ABC-type sugar transport system ATPase subunit